LVNVGEFYGESTTFRLVVFGGMIRSVL